MATTTTKDRVILAGEAVEQFAELSTADKDELLAIALSLAQDDHQAVPVERRCFQGLDWCVFQLRSGTCFVACIDALGVLGRDRDLEELLALDLPKVYIKKIGAFSGFTFLTRVWLSFFSWR
jgi:hypothetical protein